MRFVRGSVLLLKILHHFYSRSISWEAVQYYIPNIGQIRPQALRQLGIPGTITNYSLQCKAKNENNWDTANNCILIEVHQKSQTTNRLEFSPTITIRIFTTPKAGLHDDCVGQYFCWRTIIPLPILKGV